MTFYAYVPTDEGKEPMGTFNRILIELKTVNGAIRQAKRRLGTDKFRLFSYTNFYDEKTFKKLYDYADRN